MKRQVRYNRAGIPGLQEYFQSQWMWLIVNEPREIDRIKNRIFEQLAPIDELKILFEGGISNTKGLQYSILTFKSPSSNIYPKKIYDSENLKKDRNLYIRDEAGLEKYLRSTLGEGIILK